MAAVLLRILLWNNSTHLTFRKVDSLINSKINLPQEIFQTR